MNVHVDPVTSAPKRKRIPLPRTWPHVVGKGDVQVRIYRNKGHVRGKNFTTYALSYYANGKRQLRRFMDFASANREADTVSAQKAQGALGAGALTPAERVSLKEALALLAKQEGTWSAQPARLIEIVRDYTAAAALLPRNVTMAAAAEFYRK